MGSQEHNDHDVLVVVAQQVKEIHAVINGNGQPGIRQRTESLERWRSYITGALAVLMALVGWAVALGMGKTK